MRIKDLHENKIHDFSEFVTKESESGLNYDLSEDLVYFMNNDDDTYRRHVFPIVAKCLDRIKENKKTTPLMFRLAATESYKNYCNKYPIRELPKELDNKQLNEVCKMFYEEFCKHEADGRYKD